MPIMIEDGDYDPPGGIDWYGDTNTPTGLFRAMGDLQARQGWGVIQDKVEAGSPVYRVIIEGRQVGVYDALGEAEGHMKDSLRRRGRRSP